MKSVLITDDCHPVLIEGLVSLGYVCEFQPNITQQETLGQIPGYEGLIINSKIRVDQNFLDAAVNLKFIGRLGSGMEIVDQGYAEKKKIAVFSSPEGNRNAVAEHALGMLLSLANNLNRGDYEVRQNIWNREENRGFELKNKILGIIGFGNTGSQFARKLLGMEMQILAFDKYNPVDNRVEDAMVKASSMEEIQARADIISLHLPLTEETRYIVDKEFISGCKNGFILLNTSRGKCVKTKDLIVALETGKVGGACLDVFENEKPGTFSEDEKKMYDQLHAFENVIFSPHVAGWTHESKKLLAEILLEKIKSIQPINLNCQ
ncbi:MAG: NAD(P)-dependent oxidoreductase [Saprospiraceae bacterium]